ncbi:GNAT family N-acetyltransferase [Pseudorhodobacter turbinis]|uniref:L-ornithine N(alpha)-acyltransferase n=1 Tax=Pseudorhodobacter turbinis TaxID=2500533 RepID=A0A4P8EH25_9RHOB|nr:GNAT family N-acyltransferase [Pseudorhodobacter turbinis]QCO56043.1 GNAT family N-acetyltransferase [Pseudorhodobacter turbinis]
MQQSDRHFTLRLAGDRRDLTAAQRLRYRVFVEELGADGPLVDHDARLERDTFDEVFDHLLLIDTRRDAARLEDVVGVYRLLPGAPGQRFYSEDEFDISALKASGKRVLELGRSCVHPDYRGGAAMFHLWNALAEYVLARDIEVMFGAASFHGTDADALAQPLANLYHNHLAPEGLRVRAIGPNAQRMDLIAAQDIDRVAAMLGTPALIKAYLRLGGFVGSGAYVDHAFNTTDVCLVMDTGQMSARHRRFYERKQP